MSGGNRMNKRFIAGLIAGVMITSLSGCGMSQVSNSSSNYSGDLSSSINNETVSGFAPGFATNDGYSSNKSYTDGMTSDWGTDYAEVEFNTERYKNNEENGFVSVKTSPLSTFGADVDVASYLKVKSMVNDMMQFPASAVRLEEFVNYFEYDYTTPTDGEPFAVDTEIIDCPWNDDTLLLRVGVSTLKVDYESMPDMNVVLLVDVSGSMYGEDRLGLVVDGMKMLIEQFDANDKVSIVTYGSGSAILLDGESGDNKDVIIEVLDNLEASGGTNGADGIRDAYEVARDNYIDGGNNRVILCTDGDLNIGISDPNELLKFVKKEKDKYNIFLSIMGVGYGNYNDETLEHLADKGDGNYTYASSLKDAKRAFVDNMAGTMLTVAKDAKFQIEFNPTHIKGYRQLGYENRQMAAEDFADDTKDGGEIGAGQQVTVLYEIVPVDSEFNIGDVDLRYQNNESTGNSSDWMTVSVRYKEPTGNKSNLREFVIDETDKVDEPSDSTKLAASVAEFAMLLTNSEYKGTSSYEHVLDTLGELDVRHNSDIRELMTFVEDSEYITPLE